MKKSIVFFLLFLIAPTIFLASETVRGLGVKLIGIDKNSIAAEWFTFEDIIVISEAEPVCPFIQGLEVEIKLPRPLQNYPETFLLSVFSSPKPGPAEQIKEYTAIMLYQQLIPLSGRLILQIPFAANASFGSIPGAVRLDSVITSQKRPVLLTLYPAMKGLPSEITSASINIIVRPILHNLGGLRLSILPETIDKSSVSIRINNRLTVYDDIILLPPGVHHIRLESPKYRTITRTFAIEKGEIHQLNLVIEESEAKIMFEAPQDTLIFLDGVRVNNPNETIIKTTPGEHVVLFKIGEYRLSKSFTIKEDKTYTISLFLDILIEED